MVFSYYNYHAQNENFSFCESTNGVLVTLPFFFAQVNKLRSFEENGGRKTFYIIIVTKDTRVAKGSISFYIRTIMGASFKFQMGSGPIWMDDVQCKGHETSLTQCSFNGYGIHNFDHRDDAGVYCTVNFVYKEGDPNSVLRRNAIAKG